VDEENPTPVASNSATWLWRAGTSERTFFPKPTSSFYLDANLEERTRAASEGAPRTGARDEARQPARARRPLMTPLGAVILNNSHQTPEQTSRPHLDLIRQRPSRNAKTPGGRPNKSRGGERLSRIPNLKAG